MFCACLHTQACVPKFKDLCPRSGVTLLLDLGAGDWLRPAEGVGKQQDPVSPRGECFLISTTQHLAKSSIHASMGTSQWDPSLWNEVGGPLPLTATFRSPHLQIPRVEWMEREMETDGKRGQSVLETSGGPATRLERKPQHEAWHVCTRSTCTCTRRRTTGTVSAYQTPPSKVIIHDRGERKEGRRDS